MRQTDGSPEAANIKKRRIVKPTQRRLKKPKTYEYIRGPSEEWAPKPLKREMVEERTELLLQMKEGLREADAMGKEIQAMWSLFTFEKNVLNLEMATVLRQSSGHFKETDTRVLFAALGECLDNLKAETDLLKFPANKMVAEILKTVWYPIGGEGFDEEGVHGSGQGIGEERWVMGRTGPKPETFSQESGAKRGISGNEAGCHASDAHYQQENGALQENNEMMRHLRNMQNPDFKARDTRFGQSDRDEWRCLGPEQSNSKKIHRSNNQRRDSRRSSNPQSHPLEFAVETNFEDGRSQESRQSLYANAPQELLKERTQNPLNLPFASVAFKAVDVFLKAAELKGILSQKMMIEKICQSKRLCADELDWRLKQKSLMKKLAKQMQKNKDLETAANTKDQQIEFFKGILSKVLEKNGVVANGVNTLFKMFQSTNDLRRTMHNFNSQGTVVSR